MSVEYDYFVYFLQTENIFFEGFYYHFDVRFSHQRYFDPFCVQIFKTKLCTYNLRLFWEVAMLPIVVDLLCRVGLCRILVMSLCCSLLRFMNSEVCYFEIDIYFIKNFSPISNLRLRVSTTLMTVSIDQKNITCHSLLSNHGSFWGFPLFF